MLFGNDSALGSTLADGPRWLRSGGEAPWAPGGGLWADHACTCHAQAQAPGMDFYS